MTERKRVYAVKANGRWYVAELVLATKYDRDATWDETPVWSEYETTAYICPFDKAEKAVELTDDLGEKP
jgi:hypothetical protein